MHKKKLKKCEKLTYTIYENSDSMNVQFSKQMRNALRENKGGDKVK